jgi:gamma-glutamyl hercynylcysteine S-oxide hydrolase
MCRHLAYVGAAVPLHDLLFGAPHALARQAERPRHQQSGDTNPDGWGVAWYTHGADEPQLYRTVTPIWDDAEFARQSEDISCTAVLAAARLASPGASIDVTGNAPFVEGRWAFSLNGIVHGFAEGVGDELRARIDPDRRARLVGDADTEVLFALVLQLIDSGMAPDQALVQVVRDVLAITTGRLNLLLTDGTTVYATRWGNSLFRAGALVASEPLDSQLVWKEVRDESVVSREANGGRSRSFRKETA